MTIKISAVNEGSVILIGVQCQSFSESIGPVTLATGLREISRLLREWAA